MLTTEQERIARDLRKGMNGAMEGVPEDKRRDRLVTVYARDVIELLDAIDTLKKSPGKAAA